MVDAWINSGVGAACNDSFSTLKEAQEHLCHFDGSRNRLGDWNGRRVV